MRLAIDGNGDQELESLMKRVAGLETAVSTITSTLANFWPSSYMYAMHEVDRILEGVQLPNGDEAMIRKHYLAMVQLNKLTDPIKIAQYTEQWPHRHRGYCDATMHQILPFAYRPDLTVISVMVVGGSFPHTYLGIYTPTAGWYIRVDAGSIDLARDASAYPLVDEYYLPSDTTPKCSILLVAIGSEQEEPPTLTGLEAEALMTELGYPAYAGAPGDSEAKGAYLEKAHLIAQIRAYTMMARYGKVDDGVPYWYMLYQPTSAPNNPYCPLW
jgi:hypothetical protein